VDIIVPAEAQVGGQKTILVVEDEVSVRRLITRILSRAGYTVLEAGSAAEAEEVLGGSGAPDVILTDMVLPGGINGRVLVDAVRERNPGIAAVFMSGYSREIVAQDDSPGHWPHFLEKPFTPAMLLEVIRAALGES
jgi:two-component system cell cycle sensor histidine kinase/response regulator CckA